MRMNFKAMRSCSIFKKWANRNYAVFCSMGKVIKIGCLLVVYLHFANPGIASVQENDTLYRKINLEPVDVSTSTRPETYSSANRVLITIDKKEIERAAVSSVNELLEYASNIDIRQRGVNGSQADVSIRGGSFDQVLILLNGVNISDPQSGHHNLNLPVNLSSVEKIEILKGPAAWKFGPGAFTGAINFITSKSDENNTNVSIDAGQFKLHSEQISAHLKFRESNHLISFEHSQSDGYIKNTDYAINNLFYRGTLTNKNGELSAQIGISNRGFGSNSFYTPVFPNQYEETSTTIASLGIKTKGSGIGIDGKMYFRRNNDCFMLFRNNAPSWYTTHNYHTSDVFGINIIGTINLIPYNSTTIGFDGRSESIWSNVLGETRDTPVESIKYKGIELDHYYNRSIWSAFIGHKFEKNRWLANVALNLTRCSNQDFDIFIYPAFDLSYTINEHLGLFTSAGKAMRFPTFTDLYYKSAVNVGNPNLSPEETTGTELGIKFRNRGMQLSLASFYRKSDNLIDWVKLPEETIWESTNYTKIDTYGAEFSGFVDFEKLTKHNTFIKDLSIKYTYVGQTKESGEFISYYVMDYLKHRLDIGIEHKIWRNLSASWHWSFQDRNGTYTEYVNNSFGEEVDYKPFSLLDLKIQWKHKGLNIYGSINNILSTKYFDIANVEQPGRWIKFGVAKNINWDRLN